MIDVRSTGHYENGPPFSIKDILVLVQWLQSTYVFSVSIFLYTRKPTHSSIICGAETIQILLILLKFHCYFQNYKIY